MVPCVSPVSEELHAFLHVCVCFFRGETALQLLKVVIHHGEIKLLGGWQAVAFAMRTLGGRLGHSTSTNLTKHPWNRQERSADIKCHDAFDAIFFLIKTGV